MSTYRFWNAPATIVYIKRDTSGNDAVEATDPWKPIGICRGSVDISGTSDYEKITTDYNQSSSLPADQMLTSTSYRVTMELAKPYNKYADGLYQFDDEILTLGSTPVTANTEFGNQGYGNMPTIHGGDHYQLLLWSQVVRASISTSTPVTNYALFYAAIPQSFDMTWGTKATTVKCTWHCVEGEHLGTFTNNSSAGRKVAQYGYSETQAAGAPPASISF